MKKIFLVSITVCLLFSFLLTAHSQTNWFDMFGKPKYGGKIVVGASRLSPDTDPWKSFGGLQNVYMETLWMPSWTADRDVYPFSTRFVPPEYYEGLLLEKWEMVDLQTLRLQVRKGIRWHNKPPVNGREFVAADVKEYYDRILGYGKYKKPSRQKATIGFVKEINVIDKYTLELRYTSPSATGILAFQNLYSAFNFIPPPELYAPDAEGNLPIDKWENANGTGPWILKNFVKGNSAVFAKNPDYWGFDERHPENQLPYADELRMLAIPDLMTKLSALRTGKIDIVDDIPWQQAKTLMQRNPELKHSTSPNAAQAMILMVDPKKGTPFKDLRVRKAMQMSIDVETIRKNYYGGTAEEHVCGLIHPIISKTGWGYDYDEWPEELKDEYRYDPEKAKKLLAEAGYPDGFQMTVDTAHTADLALIEIFKSYFANVGIKLDINTMDAPALRGLGGSRKAKYSMWDFMGASGVVSQVTHPINSYQSTNRRNSGGVNDAHLDSMVADFNKAQSMDQAKDLVREIDKYAISQHWSIHAVPTYTYNFWNPALNGYTAEPLSIVTGWLWGRLWKNE